MLRSMFAAVSGLQAHQTFMDVVGNNIANVNTTGFKAGTVEFEDLLSQTLQRRRRCRRRRSPAAPTRRRSASVCASRASARTSRRAPRRRPGRSTDFAIQGDGFFVVQAGRRAGLHAQRQLHARRSRPARDRRRRPRAGLAGRPAGQRQHQLEHRAGQDPGGPDHLAGHDRERSTSAATCRPTPRSGTTIDVSIDVNNSARRVDPAAHGVHEGRRHGRQRQLDGHDLRQREHRDRGPDATCSSTRPATSRPATSRSPRRSSTRSRARRARGRRPAPTLNFGTATAADRLTGAATLNSVAALSQDGSGIGSLVSFSVGQNGLISGVFSNGRTQALGQIALATFADPAGSAQAGRLAVHDVGQLRRRPDRRRRRRRPGHAHAAGRSRARTSTSVRNSPT